MKRESDVRKIERKNSRRNMWKGKVIVELGDTSIWSRRGGRIQRASLYQKFLGASITFEMIV
jgi:hypothetical protein